MTGLSPALRAIFLAFAGLAAIAGGLLFIGATDTEDWFSWTIQPPLTAAALGAFFWSACALLATAARSPDWPAARPVAYPVLAIATILLIVTLVHLDRFDLDSLFGIFWLCAYIVAPPLLIWGIATQPGRERGEQAGAALPGPLRWVLLIEGVVLFAVGALMLFAPGGAEEIWPWALSALTSRALGAFNVGVGLVALLVVRQDRIGSFAGMLAAYVSLGLLQLLAVALHSPDLGEDDLSTAVYLAFWVAVVATAAYAWIAARASSGS